MLGSSGAAWKAGQLDFTGAQMVLTLKLIAAAMSLQDGARRAAGGAPPPRPYPAAKALDTPPTLVEFLSYAFAAGNLLAGPFLELKDYLDYMTRKVRAEEGAGARAGAACVPVLPRLRAGGLRRRCGPPRPCPPPHTTPPPPPPPAPG